jgi:hypothetical protein
MGRTTCPFRTLVLCLLLASRCGGQERELGLVKSESQRLRMAPAPLEEDFWKDLKVFRERSAGFHRALRDWVELLLPKEKSELDAGFSSLNSRLDAHLQRAGLTEPASTGPVEPASSSGDFTPGLVTRIEVSRPAEDPDKLAVIVGVGVPCGDDEAVYVYDYSRGPLRRVLESHGTRDHDESLSDVRFSKRDAFGTQLILTLRYAVQCGSSWSLLSYDLFRLSAADNTAMPILSREQGIWFGGYDPYQVRLEPDELLLEVRDRSIDSGIHNRAHVLHFNAAHGPAERIDPVALQPQDFVDEWLTSPWSEMESRSAEDGRDKFKKWYDFLAGDFIAGDFTMAQACKEKPGQWQVGINLDWIKGKEIPEPLSVYFLVQQFEKYRFKMVGISFDRQDGCPGDSPPSEESPSLFPAREKKP